MTNHEAGMREHLDAAIERIQKTLREYPWHIGRSGPDTRDPPRRDG